MFDKFVEVVVETIDSLTKESVEDSRKKPEYFIYFEGRKDALSELKKLLLDSAEAVKLKRNKQC